MVAVNLKFNVALHANNFDSIKKFACHNPITNFAKDIFAAEERTVKSIKAWHDDALAVLNENNERLDEVLPPNKLQKVLHSFYQKRLAPIFEHKKACAFNAWIDSNGHGDWYQKLGIVLAKLPLRAVRNVLSQVYALLKAMIFTVAHPLKAMNEAAAFFVRFIYALTQPQTYSTVGAGIVGVSIGQSSAVGIGVGSALVVGGIAYDALRTLVKAQQGQKWKGVKEILLEKHFKQMPEAFATGLISGVVANFFQKTVVFSQTEAKQYLNTYVQKHRLPTPYGHWYYPSENTLIVSWGYKLPKNLPHGYWRNGNGWWNAYYSRVPLPKVATVASQMTIASNVAAQSIQLGRAE